MNTPGVLTWLRRLFFLSLGLMLVLQSPGEPVQAALPATSVSVSISNPSCGQSLPASGVCSIQFGSLTASGSDSSFSRIEVLVNGKLRVLVDGFFESTAYLNSPMLPGGLKVTCGMPNEGGSPDYGKAYLITANAYMADGTSASASENVFCPAYVSKTYMPFIKR